MMKCNKRRTGEEKRTRNSPFIPPIIWEQYKEKKRIGSTNRADNRKKKKKKKGRTINVRNETATASYFACPLLTYVRPDQKKEMRERRGHEVVPENRSKEGREGLPVRVKP